MKTKYIIIFIVIIFSCSKNNNINFSEETENLKIKYDKIKSEYESLFDDFKLLKNTSYKKVTDNPSKDEFLVGDTNEFLIGIATINGYYIKLERTVWGKTKDCDNFVITGGSKSVINYFVNLIKKGNGVNKLNDKSQPIVNLDLENLNNYDRSIIKESTETKTVKILIFFPEPVGREAPVCFSLFDIIRVN